MSEGLGKLHFWLTFVPLNLVFMGQLVIGYEGMQRRLYDPSVYDFLKPLLPLNRGISHAAYLLGAAQLIFVVNFFWSLARGRARGGEPLGGRHARVDGRLAAAAPQLRSDPDRRARAARARPPGRARARARLAGTGRGARGGAGADPTGRARPDVDGAGMTTAPATASRRREIDAQVGLVIFLGATAMLFAALLLAYAIVRAQAPSWPPGRRAAVPARRRRPPTRWRSSPPAWRCGAGWARAALRVRRGVSGRPGAALAAPGGDPPRPQRRRARRGLLRALGAPRAARARRPGGAGARPARAGCASLTLYWDFVLVVWAGRLRRGVPAVRAAAALVARRLLLAAPACTRTLTSPGAPPPFTAPVTLGGRVVAPAALEHGREVFTHFCRPCHGDAGDGKGTAAAGLSPPPRDLRLGVYKFAAVAAGQLPNDADFVRTIRHGLHGTAMLAWDVPEAELDDLIQYMKSFSPRWRTETRRRSAGRLARSLGRARGRRRSPAARASTTAWPSARSPATPPTRPRPRSTPSPRS